MLNVVVILNAINQVCKSTPGAAGSRSACGRAIGSFVPGYADVARDPENGQALSSSSRRRGTRRRRNCKLK